MIVVTWLISLLALTGTILNAEKRRAGFYLWLITNLFWFIYDFKIGAYAQSALFFAYFLLAIRGLIVWKRKEGK
jgi:nicotinamide riboside transporter PnuC